MAEKSYFSHSKHVAYISVMIAKELKLPIEQQKDLYYAALLHDIGKLVISNDIIDKEGKLNEKERYEINKHTYFTRWILEQIDGFEDITEFASNHHEKLNGKESIGNYFSTVKDKYDMINPNDIKEYAQNMFEQM